MAHKRTEELQLLSSFLDEGLEMLKQYRKYPEMTAVVNKLNLHFTQDSNYIHSLLGFSREQPEDERVHMKPLTQMFGQPIAHVPVKSTDTTPTDMEKAKFIAEVNDFYAHFAELPDEKLFNKSTLPGGDMIIRAVAKMSGYPEYEAADIDVDYITAVKMHIEEKAQAQKTLDEAAAKTK